MKGFKVIPGFVKYKTDGEKVINAKSEKEMSVKSGTDKYQLFNTEGKRKAITLEEIEALFLKPVSKKVVSKKDVIISLSTSGKTIGEIAKETGYKNNTVNITLKVHKIRTLDLEGKTPEEISEETGYCIATVTRNLPKKK